MAAEEGVFLLVGCLLQHYRSLDGVSLQNTCLAIGVFDGVHRGHQVVLKQLTADARQVGAPAVVLTFYPHPTVILGRRNDLKYLTLPDEKAAVLFALGVDAVITHPFDKSLSALSAHEFMGRVQAHLGVRRLWVGDDFALGHNRQGNVACLTELGKTLGYEVQAITPLTNGGEKISSRHIRTLLDTGQVVEAATQLGRYYVLSGPIIHGDGRGRKINVPTANMKYPTEKVVPANGVYACWAWLGGQRRKAVTNIGIRPTFTPEDRMAHIETHLLDFNQELYGEEVRLEFVARLRDEMRFSSAEELLRQIHTDIDGARHILR